MSEPAVGTWTVSGMTCGHCVASVTEEVTELGGVRTVRVELESGTLTIESDEPLHDDDVRRAVEDAGYRLA